MWVIVTIVPGVRRREIFIFCDNIGFKSLRFSDSLDFEGLVNLTNFECVFSSSNLTTFMEQNFGLQSNIFIGGVLFL